MIVLKCISIQIILLRVNSNNFNIYNDIPSSIYKIDMVIPSINYLSYYLICTVFIYCTNQMNARISINFVLQHYFIDTWWVIKLTKKKHEYLSCNIYVWEVNPQDLILNNENWKNYMGSC